MGPGGSIDIDFYYGISVFPPKITHVYVREESLSVVDGLTGIVQNRITRHSFYGTGCCHCRFKQNKPCPQASGPRLCIEQCGDRIDVRKWGIGKVVECE